MSTSPNPDHQREGSAQSVAVTLTSDFDCTTQFANQAYGRWIYVGTAGNVKAQKINDSAPVVFNAVPAGTRLGPALWTKISSTANGTTASNLVLEQ